MLDHLTGDGAAAAGPRPRVLFATHYHRLAAEPALRGRVQLGHMASELARLPAGGGGGRDGHQQQQQAGAARWHGGGGGGGNAGARGPAAFFDGVGGALAPELAQPAGARSAQQPGPEPAADQLVLVNTFELRPGSAPNGSCGIDVAAVAGLPGAVVSRARVVAAAMEGGCEGGCEGASGEGESAGGGLPLGLAPGPGGAHAMTASGLGEAAAWQGDFADLDDDW